jgi:hypothetical protein
VLLEELVDDGELIDEMVLQRAKALKVEVIGEARLKVDERFGDRGVIEMSLLSHEP